MIDAIAENCKPKNVLHARGSQALSAMRPIPQKMQVILFGYILPGSFPPHVWFRYAVTTSVQPQYAEHESTSKTTTTTNVPAIPTLAPHTTGPYKRLQAVRAARGLETPYSAVGADRNGAGILWPLAGGL